MKKREIALHLCLEKSFIVKEFDLKHYQSIWLTDFSGHVNTSRSISWLWVPWGSGLRWVLSTLACRILRWAGLLDETSNAEATCHSRWHDKNPSHYQVTPIFERNILEGGGGVQKYIYLRGKIYILKRQFKANVLGTFGLWGEGDLYRAIPAVTRVLGFCGLTQRTAPNLVYIGTEMKLYKTICSIGFATNQK